MKVRTAIADVLGQAGIEVAFGVLGAGNMYIMHELIKRHRVAFVPTATEDGAVLAAGGASQLTGALTIATVSYGPGVTNTVTALRDAAHAHQPILILTGDQPSAALPEKFQSLQAIDHEPIVAATGAAYIRMRAPETCVDDTIAAIRTAIVQSRPVVFAVPTDLQRTEVDVTFPADVLPAPAAIIDPHEDALDHALGVIASARRPLVLAGKGAVTARDDVLAFAERLGAPVATSLYARALFAGEPRDLGVFGSLSTSAAGEVISEADAVIAFGASLNWWTTSQNALLDGKRVVHVDVDPNAIGRHTRVDVGVVGDTTRTIAAFTKMLDAVEHAPSGFFDDAMRERLAAHDPASEFTDHSGDGTVDLRSFIVEVDQVLPDDRTVVIDVGRFFDGPLRYLSNPDPGGFVFKNAFGAMATGLATAVGAGYVRHDRPTVLVVGDGGLLMGPAELNTAVAQCLDLIVLVMNDEAYGQEYKRYSLEGMDPTLSLLPSPSFAALAAGFGARGMTVTSLDDMPAVAEAIAGRDGPLVIDVKVDPSKPLE